MHRCELRGKTLFLRQRKGPNQLPESPIRNCPVSHELSCGFSDLNAHNYTRGWALHVHWFPDMMWLFAVLEGRQILQAVHEGAPSLCPIC